MNSPERLPEQLLLRQARDLNGLSISDIAQITGEKQKTVEAWLYDPGKRPSWRALFLLDLALHRAGVLIPDELTRFIAVDTGRARHWGKLNRVNAQG